jgi:uncharacterized protein YecE (DUF72 family)
VFKTVCVGAAFFTFPSEKYLEGLVARVPSDFQFGFKVTDEITEEPGAPAATESACGGSADLS